MDKDEFARMKARQDIVTAFINKLEKADMKDIDLIPALIDYVNTGNYAMFDEYNKFRTMFDTEQKAENVKRRTADAQQQLEKAQAEYEDVQKKVVEYKRIINDEITDYNRWRTDALKKEVEEHPESIYPTLGFLQEFLQECIEQNPNAKKRRLFVKDGNKLCSVTAIITDSDSNKAILETNSPTTITLEPR